MHIVRIWLCFRGRNAVNRRASRASEPAVQLSSVLCSYLLERAMRQAYVLGGVPCSNNSVVLGGVPYSEPLALVGTCALRLSLCSWKVAALCLNFGARVM